MSDVPSRQRDPQEPSPREAAVPGASAGAAVDAGGGQGARRVVVLVSGSGTLLQSLLDAARQDPGLGYSVVGVLSDRDDAFGLERARRAGVPTRVVALQDFPDRASWDVAVAQEVAVLDPEIVVLAGFMRILGHPFLERFADCTINTHPALLPAFPGAHGVRDALAYGAKVTGSSVIFVDAGTDSGPVVAQRPVEVLDGDDEETLHERIKVVERELLVEVVSRMAREGWTVTGRKVTFGGTPLDGAAGGETTGRGAVPGSLTAGGGVPADTSPAAP